jgi:hypothetical protein
VNNRKLCFLVVAAALSTAALSGCNKGPDPAKVREDVAKAQADGQKKIADAQAKVDKANAEAQKDATVDNSNGQANGAPGTAPNGDQKKIADAQYDLDKARAEAAYDVSKANCEAQTGDAKKTCQDQAKAQYDSAVAAAKQKNDAANQRASG